MSQANATSHTDQVSTLELVNHERSFCVLTNQQYATDEFKGMAKEFDQDITIGPEEVILSVYSRINYFPEEERPRIRELIRTKGQFYSGFVIGKPKNIALRDQLAPHHLVDKTHLGRAMLALDNAAEETGSNKYIDYVRLPAHDFLRFLIADELGAEWVRK